MTSSSLCNFSHNGSYCDQLKACRAIFKTELSFSYRSYKYFDNSLDKCFCKKCRKARTWENGTDIKFKRGTGVYILPEGWSRICLKHDKQFCEKNKVFSIWHPTYHGTSRDGAQGIINDGLKFLKPGDKKPDGTIHKIREDSRRIRSVFKRWNQHTKSNEMFDPKQLFTSPSVAYGTYYCKPYTCDHPFNSRKKVVVNFMFQIRQRPKSYNVGQETICASEEISPHVSNKSIEYYTKNNSKENIVPAGLMMKFEESEKETISMYETTIKKETPMSFLFKGFFGKD